MAENPIIAIIDSGVDNDIPFKDKIMKILRTIMVMGLNVYM